MKTARLFLFMLILVNPFIIQGQDKIWYFGNQAGIDFTGATPIAINNSAMSSVDYSATISDGAGNLLFYTNGMEVWDKNHSIMLNGSGLFGQASNGQCALILQQPGTDLYYIFTVGIYNSTNGLRYHIVDLSQNGGFGSVVSKNNLLLTPSTERLDAVYDPITDSYWIVTHGWGSNSFYSYNLSGTGLNLTPVISSVGLIHTGNSYNSMGQLCISPSKNKIVCGTYTAGVFELFDFDITTGVLSNPITLGGFSNSWGAAFSPDSRLLYVTEWMNTNVIQMDITSGNAATILSTANVVGNGTGPGGLYQVGYLQLAPDNKIYGAVFDDNHLLVITYPDSMGASCAVVDNGFYLNGKTSSAGLCRSVKGRLEKTSINDVNTPKDFLIYPNPFLDEITISNELQTVSESEFDFIIYNSLGKIVKVGKNIYSQNLKIDMNEIRSGIYTLRISSGDFIHHSKLVKQ